MINYTVIDTALADQSVDLYAVFAEEGSDFKSLSTAHALYPDIRNWLKVTEFTGKKGDVRLVPLARNKKAAYLLVIGLGKATGKKALPIEQYRRAVAVAVRHAEKNKCSSLGLEIPNAALFGVSEEYLGKQIAMIVAMAHYHFDTYITDKDRKIHPLTDVVLAVAAKNKKAIDQGVKEGVIIAHAVNNARHWIDTPPSDLTPAYLSDKASVIAKKGKLKLTVFNEKQINEMGMGGLAGVSRGSEEDCRLVIMEYKTTKKSAPTVAFVGKGITFDSGGLSLKPANSMESMKDDMSGAAAVIAAMEAIAALKPEINVIALAPIAENLPSGKATKPGDILKFYNGKTAEVKNTDAEGRLILADALSYAVKHYKPDAMIDFATLTGACPIALGPFFSGLMSQHDDLVERIEEAAQQSGDRVWRLPMDNDFKPSVQSHIADISNICERKYYAQTICASFFLQNFVGDVPWAHLDIAGTAFDVPDIPYYRPGATGAGVRLMVELAMDWKK
jgi:leucyl aminopeptidase